MSKYIWIVFITYANAVAFNARVTKAIITNSEWRDGITNNYSYIWVNKDSTKFAVPLDTIRYKKYFSKAELDSARDIDSTFRVIK